MPALKLAPTPTHSLSPFTSLGPDLFQLLLTHLSLSPSSKPLTTDGFRRLLPFALVNRTHYNWTFSFIRHLYILPTHHHSHPPPHPIPTPRPERKIPSNQLRRALPLFNSLVSLHLSLAATVDDTLLLSISHFHPFLRKLRLPAARLVSPTGLLSIASTCRHLEFLDVSYCPLLDDSLAKVVLSLPCLKHLNAAYIVRLSDNFVRGIIHSRIEWLCISACPHLSSKALQYVRDMPRLHTLVLRCSPGASDEGLAKLQGSNLSRVDFGLGRGVTDKGLSMLKEMKSLEGVGLSQCVELSDGGLRFLGSLRRLKWIDVSYCGGLGDEGLEGLDQCAELEWVNVSGCERVGDRGVRALCRLGGLERLEMAYCSRIGVGGVESVCKAKNRPLTYVDVRQCRGISDGGVQKLKEACKEVRAVD